MNTKPLFFVALFLISQWMTCPAQMNLRGWHADGQTWLVWEDTVPSPETYRIFKSSDAINTISSAEQTGRIFEKEWSGIKLNRLVEGTRWTIPDGIGGTYTLKDNEALFVFTPHEEKSEYFTVVRDGDSIIGTNNHVGPIEQTTEKVQCHLQLTGIQEESPYRVYAHWIDGRDHWDSGRVAYPVMANKHFNGTGQLFRIWEYPEDSRPELVPAVIFLHGGGGWFGGFCPCYDGRYKTYNSDAVVFCPDDGLFIKRTDFIGQQKSYWLGFWEGYNRFLLPEEQSIPDDGLVINYTMRRIIWELDWIIDNEGIETAKISLMGGSMGGRGANYLARAYPELVAAWLSLSPGIVPVEGDPFVGSVSQNLTTNLPGSPGVLDVMGLHAPLSAVERDIPFGKIVGGRADQSKAALTAEMIQAYKNVNDSGWGAHIYWDDRGHVYTEGSYWADSYRLTASALTTYRNDKSFPAFFNDDQDFDTPGRQPDMGSGDPADGSMWGTWGGYYSWDPESIVESATTWKADLFLMSSGESLVDIPAFDSSRTDLTIRRPQQFSPPEDSRIGWTLMRLSDSRILQSGEVIVGANGVVTIPDLTIFKEKCELSLSVIPSAVNLHHKVENTSNESAVIQIFPNPISSNTTIIYNLQQSGSVYLAVYNTSGQIVHILENGYKAAGHHSIYWNATGSEPGLYILRIETGQFVGINKFILSS